MPRVLWYIRSALPGVLLAGSGAWLRASDDVQSWLYPQLVPGTLSISGEDGLSRDTGSGTR